MQNKIRSVKCDKCGAIFLAASHNARHCPACRRKSGGDNSGAVLRLRPSTRQLYCAQRMRRAARDRRLKARDAEYAKLNTPVATHVAANGMVVEVRGQPRFGSNCGTLGGMSSEVSRRYL